MQQSKQLLSKIQTAHDRLELAAILVTLAERAENNPMLQETLKKLELPAPYNVLEYIKPGNRRGYWGRIPYTREHPSARQLQARLNFSEINYSLFGTKGTVERPDGTRIGLVNLLAGKIMRSCKVVSEEEKANRQRQKSIERIATAGF